MKIIYSGPPERISRALIDRARAAGAVVTVKIIQPPLLVRSFRKVCPRLVGVLNKIPSPEKCGCGSRKRRLVAWMEAI